jgi:hypothetical protein
MAQDEVTSPQNPMLEFRPTCERCNKALTPDSLEARICSYECTFCVACVEQVLSIHGSMFLGAIYAPISCRIVDLPLQYSCESLVACLFLSEASKQRGLMR